MKTLLRDYKDNYHKGGSEYSCVLQKQKIERYILIKIGTLLYIHSLCVFLCWHNFNWAWKVCIHYSSRSNTNSTIKSFHIFCLARLPGSEKKQEVTSLTNFSIADLNSTTFQHLWHWLTLAQWRWGKQSGHQTGDSPYLRTVTLVGYHCSAVHPITTKTFLVYLWDWFL